MKSELAHLLRISQLPNKPGVYRFLDQNRKVLYVGKAKELKKRVTQYFRSNLTDKKTIALMGQVADLEITLTENENQALLLESNLIKEYRPKYNILLRDDKSYPYLLLSDHPYPRLDYCRRKNTTAVPEKRGRYFGPYPNSGSVRENLAFIQKLFKLRQCSDVFFSHRSRPCLQYQINRCTAPCVNYVTEFEYQKQVKNAVDFLEGKNDDVIRSIEAQMMQASEHHEYEKAAEYRDYLIRLRQLQNTQHITGGHGHVDVFGVAQLQGESAVTVVYIRQGQLIGHKTFIFSDAITETPADTLNAFIPQYYFNSFHETEKIDRVLLSHSIPDQSWIQSALQEKIQRNLKIVDRKTPAFREWIAIAIANAQEALKQHQSEKNNILLKLEALQNKLSLPAFPERIECFDISHTLGEATKASCVVFGTAGPIKKAYRQFNIDGITPGDDYAAMQQALKKRYTKIKMQSELLPDLIIIDGGKGQLKMAASVLEELQITGVMLMGIAKGEGRKPGLEKLILWDQKREISLKSDDPVLHWLQFIRDEAHRFAITAHRKKRNQNRLQSVLDTIQGVGKKRKMSLLKHFGGLQELKKAGIEEIAQVTGISHDLAEKIYAALHNDN